MLYNIVMKRVFTQESLEKMKVAKLGKKRPNHSIWMTNNSPIKGKVGEKAPNWKGGIPQDRSYARERQRKYLQKIRKLALDTLGGKCVKCGFDDLRALQIDHIKGGGSQERKTLGFNGNFHLNVVRSHMKEENKYQLLCANCNWIKRHENNEVKSLLLF